MQNKVVNGSQKEEKRQRMKGGHSVRSRARGPEFFLFTMLTVILFTALLWSYEPHLSSTLLSIQDQFLLPSSGEIQELITPNDRTIQEKFLERAQTEEEWKKKVTVNVEKPNTVDEAFSKPSITKSSFEGSSATDKELEDKSKRNSENVANAERLSTNEGSLVKEKENKKSTSNFEKTEKADKVRKNGENTIVATQGSPVAEPKGSPVAVAEPKKGSPANQGSSSKDSTSTFEKKEDEGGEGFATQGSPASGSSANSPTRDKEEKGSTSISNKLDKVDKESSGSSAIQNSTATNGSSTAEWSSAKGNQGENASFTYQNKDQVAQSEKSSATTTQGSSITATEVPSVANGSSTTKWSTTNIKEKEDKSSSFIDDKKEQVANESFTSEGSSTTQLNGSSTTEWSTTKDKEDKNQTFIEEKKGNSEAAVHVESKIEEKAKAEDNVENTKAMTEDSVASSNGSSAVQSSPATQQWSANQNQYLNSTSNFQNQGSNAAQGSSVSEAHFPTEGSSTTEWSQNNSVSTSQEKVCNYAKGRWVWDNKRPLYDGSKCKRWLSWMWACRITNREDFRFESYKWQPENCDMPDFERHAFLKRMQNKTIAFVGDSLGRQQFQSMMCMLTGGDDDVEVQDVSPEYNLTSTKPKPKPGRIHVPRYGAFRFPETNTTVIYHWSTCLCDLVPLNTSDPKTPVAMHLDRPPSFLAHFLPKFDVLVLNTGHHWNHGKIRLNRWVMHVGGAPVKNLNIAMAKNLTIVSIAKWVDSQLTAHPELKVNAFFRTISPRHFFNGEWNTGGICENTTPLARGSEVREEWSRDELVGNAVKGTMVKLLDITAISELRDEGHLSKYGVKATKGIMDCLHWCLPGVPDTWNEILAAQI